jgi:hypothetical protein
MKYIEAPEEYSGNERSLFLAGGISNCPNWQSDLVRLLENENILLFNPRRKSFPANDPSASKKQIEWEYKYLKKADIFSFWFPKETICTITLYELGKAYMTNKPIFVGINPRYERKLDIEVQTKLARPEIEIVYSLDKLAGQIKDCLKNFKYPDIYFIK